MSLSQWHNAVFLIGVFWAGAALARAHEQPNPLHERVNAPAPALDQRNVHFEHADKDRVFLEHGGVGGITVITQDQDGFIWVGGENGLLRYDGHRFRTYKKDVRDPTSICGNYIRNIAFDNDGVMWLATTSGLCRYINNSDQFFSYPTDPNSNNSILSGDVAALAIDARNRLYIGTSKGVSVLNPARTHFIAHYTPGDGPTGITYDHVESLLLNGNDLWIGTVGGLNRLDVEDNVMTRFKQDPTDPNSLPHNDIRSITLDQEGHLWLATLGGGLLRRDKNSGMFSQYLNDASTTNTIGENTVWMLHVDSQARLWAATDSAGLSLYRSASDDFITFKHEPSNPNSLAADKVRALFEDNRGDLWVGTFKGTLQLFSRDSAQIRKFTYSEHDVRSIPNEAILAFKEAQNGLIWIGTENGAAVYNPDNDEFQRISYDKQKYPQGLQAGAVLSLEEAPNGDMWLGTWSGGLHRYDLNTRRFKNISEHNSEATVNNSFIWDLLLDQEQRLWIATQIGGLNMLDTKTGEMRYFLNDPNDDTSISRDFVYTLMEDRARNELWIGTKLGLNRLDLSRVEQPHFERFLHDPSDPTSLTDHRINCMLILSNGEFWIGTENGGINIYNREQRTFEAVFTQGELPSSNISSMIEDSEGYLWVTTPSGAVRINVAKRTREKTYYRHHGLAGDRFNRDATLLSRQGDTYLGSSTGFSVIKHSPLDSQAQALVPYINSLKVNYNEVMPAADGLIQVPIHKTHKILLNHLQNAIYFEFSAMSFRAPMYNKYRYRLTGFEQQWHETNTSNANYTNLDPGNYLFEVFAEDSDGRASAIPAQLAITIRPSPWKTWWAYGIYYLTVLGLMYSLYHYLSTVKQSRQYKHLSHSDILTGIFNRAGVEAHIHQALANANQEGEHALLLIDVDHFKAINDGLGHDAGDDVLQSIAKIISSTLRHTDILGRWGGDELALLVTQVKPETARIIAKKIQAAVHSHPFQLANNMRVTLSIGIAYSQLSEPLNPLFKRADLALYEAKRAGRNRIIEINANGGFIDIDGFNQPINEQE